MVNGRRVSRRPFLLTQNTRRDMKNWLTAFAFAVPDVLVGKLLECPTWTVVGVCYIHFLVAFYALQLDDKLNEIKDAITNQQK